MIKKGFLCKKITVVMYLEDIFQSKQREEMTREGKQFKIYFLRV